MAVDYYGSRKDGDTKWAHRYLLDPLNSVEAWQDAQVGGQYNNVHPTQHKQVAATDYYDGENRERTFGLGRSASQRVGKSQNQDDAPKRSNSVRNRLIRRFTDDKQDRRYATLRPLNEIPDKEVSQKENINVLQGERNHVSKESRSPTVPVPEKTSEQSNSNNPWRDSMKQNAYVTPPSSPKRHDNQASVSTNPFRDPQRGVENLTPPSSPPRPASRGMGSRHPNNRPASRNNGLRSPHRPPSRSTETKPVRVKRTKAADCIDVLDTSFYGMAFHHEGPYDATLSHKNRNPLKSPVEATKYGNQMALKATAKADIENSVTRGRPLDGVAAFPPGARAPGGQVMEYEEYDLHRKDGNYKRYPDLEYRDEDLKGKGIVGYDGDLKEKEEKENRHRRGKSFEIGVPDTLQTTSKKDKSGNTTTTAVAAVNDTATPVRRGGSTAGRLEGAAAKIKRTFSLKKR